MLKALLALTNIMYIVKTILEDNLSKQVYP